LKKLVKPGKPELVRGTGLASFGLWGWLASCLAVSAVFGFQSFFPSAIGLASNVLTLLCVAAGLGSVLLCVRRYGLAIKTRFQASWFSFAIGFGLWTAAESIWAAYYTVFGVAVPNYSIADIFYMAGYVPIFVGLLLYIGTFDVALQRKRIAAAAVVIALAFAVVSYTVLPTELAAGGTLLQTLDDLSFIILDLVMLSLVVLTFTIFVGGRISKWLMVLGGAAVLYVIGDEDFLIQTANGTYYNGSYNDLIFLLAYLTFALAFYLHRREW